MLGPREPRDSAGAPSKRRSQVVASACWEQFASGFLAEKPVQYEPLVVLLCYYQPEKSRHRIVVGKHAYYIGIALDPAVQPLQMVGRMNLSVGFLRKQTYEHNPHRKHLRRLNELFFRDDRDLP